MSSKQQSTGSTDSNQPKPTAHKSGMTRRDLLRRSAVGAATVGAIGTGAVRLDHGPVGNSQAIAPVVAAGTAAKLAAGTAVGGAAVGWAVREFELLGSDDPPEGETADSLLNSFQNAVQTRKSVNSSMIVDNFDILDGIENLGYDDGKLEAIDALNEQVTEEEVKERAVDAALEYLSGPKERALKSWNESINELESFYNAVEDHPDTDYSDVTNGTILESSGTFYDFNGLEFDSSNHELPNGDEIEIKTVDILADGSPNQSYTLGPYNFTESNTGDWYPYSDEGRHDGFRVTAGEGSTWYLSWDDWEEVFDRFDDMEEQLVGEMEKWVEGVYGDVQSGELVLDDLLSPRQQAELTAEDEDFPQALADLQALNVAVDLEREAEIHLTEIDATVYGQIAYSGDGSLETGTVDPDDKDGTIYLTYDVSQGQGEWSAHDEGIDGGELTFTSEPFIETLYILDTSAGETVELTSEDFEEDEDEEEWVADLSDDLDDGITEVDRIEYFAEADETEYQTIPLEDEFEIVTYTDGEGNEYDESDFERSEPHTDDNYITEEEWKDREERYNELIDKYEDAQDSGISVPGVEDVLDGEANGLIGIAVVGFVLVSAILSALNPLS